MKYKMIALDIDGTLLDKDNKVNKSTKDVLMRATDCSAHLKVAGSLVYKASRDLDKIDNDKCNKSFDKFLKLHEEEIKRLSNYDNLSSMGIKKAV